MARLQFDHGYLRLLGLDASAEALYRTVLRYPGEPLWAMSDRTGQPEPLLQEQLRPLTELRLVRLLDGRVHAEPPELAIGRLVDEHAHALQMQEDQLATLRAAVPEFVATYEQGRGAGWEPVPIDAIDIAELVGTMETLARNSTGELLFWRPDQYALPSGRRMDEVVIGELERGRRSRVVYPTGIGSPLPDRLRRRVAAGERARALPTVPTRLAIFGDQALVIPEDWQRTDGRRIVVRQPAIVAAMTALFDAYWARATPVPGLRWGDDADERPEDGDRPDTRAGVRVRGSSDELLRLLARGAKDEQIARVLGVSLRTVRRRVAVLMDELGVESRFQAGAEAVRRGHL